MHVNFTKTGRNKVVGEVEYEVEFEDEGEVKDLTQYTGCPPQVWEKYSQCTV